ncbi:MAG: GntR family transcriptional regulator [Planctomycetota bacterium]|nr:GntR family transcriptional regulator [Planctomycetota bacterium]
MGKRTRGKPVPADPSEALTRNRAASGMVADLIAKIHSGALPPGALVSSGPALSKQYGISYQTVVRALGELVERGWLVRRQGRGTYVAPHPPRESAAEAFAERRTVLLALDPQSLIRGRFGYPIAVSLDEALTHAGLRVRYAPLSEAGENALLEELAGGGAGPEAAALLVGLDRPLFLARARRRCPHLPMLAVHGAPDGFGTPREPHTDAILVDDRPGARVAGGLLVQAGHSKIGFLGGPRDDPRARSRYDGLCEALKDAGLKPRAAVWGSAWDEEAGREAAPELLDALFEDAAPAAVFCANDRHASGLYDTARERGLRIPEALSVVGFDDNDLAAGLDPPLTTFRIDRDAYGRQAALLVVQRLAQPNLPPQFQRVPVKRIDRASIRSLAT